MATNLTPLIAQLMAEQGQARGSALAQIGTTIGQIPEQMAREKDQQLREQQMGLQSQMTQMQMQQMRREQASRDAGMAAIQAATDPNTGETDHVKAANRWAQTDPMAANTYLEGTLRTQSTSMQIQEARAQLAKLQRDADQGLTDNFAHLGALGLEKLNDPNASEDDVRQSMLGLVGAGVGNKTIRPRDAQDILDKTQGASKEQLRAVYQSYLDQSPTVQRQIIEDQAKNTVDMNGQLVNKGTGKTIGPVIPKQATPLNPIELQIKQAELAALQAKAAGKEPMSQKDRAELALQIYKAEIEIRRDTQNADPNDLGQSLPAPPMPSILSGLSGGGGLGAHAAAVNGQRGLPPAPGGGAPAPAAGGAVPGAAPAAPAAPPEPPVDGPAGPRIRAAIAAGVRGDDFLKALPPLVAVDVKDMAEGNKPYPTGAALRDRGVRQIVDLAEWYDPSFDASVGPARFALRKDLTTTNGKGGQSIIAINRALEHGGNLSDDIEALNNLPLEDLNKGINWLKNKFGSSAVKNFETDRDAFSNEMERLFRGSSGSTADIEHLKEHLDQAQGQQAQRDVLNHYFGLLRGQSNSLEQQRDNGMGPAAGKSIPIIFEKNLAALDKVGKRARGETVPSSVVNPSTPASGEWDFNPVTGKIEPRKD